MFSGTFYICLIFSDFDHFPFLFVWALFLTITKHYCAILSDVPDPFIHSFHSFASLQLSLSLKSDRNRELQFLFALLWQPKVYLFIVYFAVLLSTLYCHLNPISFVNQKSNEHKKSRERERERKRIRIYNSICRWCNTVFWLVYSTKCK